MPFLKPTSAGSRMPVDFGIRVVLGPGQRSSPVVTRRPRAVPEADIGGQQDARVPLHHNRRRRVALSRGRIELAAHVDLHSCRPPSACRSADCLNGRPQGNSAPTLCSGVSGMSARN